MKEPIAKFFRTKMRDEMVPHHGGGDVCFAPVLSMEEAPRHPHNRRRGTLAKRRA